MAPGVDAGSGRPRGTPPHSPKAPPCARDPAGHRRDETIAPAPFPAQAFGNRPIGTVLRKREPERPPDKRHAPTTRPPRQGRPGATAPTPASWRDRAGKRRAGKTAAVRLPLCARPGTTVLVRRSLCDGPVRQSWQGSRRGRPGGAALARLSQHDRHGATSAADVSWRGAVRRGSLARGRARKAKAEWARAFARMRWHG